MGWFSRLLRPRPPLIAETEFDAAVARLPILNRLNTRELARLRNVASLFMHTKRFTAAGGAEVSRGTQLAIALQACLLILNLDERSYRGWREIVLPHCVFAPAPRNRRGGGGASFARHSVRRILAQRASGVID